MEEVHFIKIGDDFSNIATQLKQECVDYLTQVTKENGLIELDHPKYISDLYSTVYSISFNDDENRLSIEIEDDDDYTVDRLSIDDLYALALVVYNKLKC